MAMPRLKGGKGQRKGHAVQEKTLLFNAVLMYLCMQACVLCACMYACIYVCMYVCVQTFIVYSIVSPLLPLGCLHMHVLVHACVCCLLSPHECSDERASEGVCKSKGLFVRFAFKSLVQACN